METNSLIISHWNCNSIKSHKPEIYSLINKKHNFICLNETKLSNSDNISFENYEIIRKDRNRRGGGVAILARTDMKFEKIDTLDSFGLELLAIKVKLKTVAYIIAVVWYIFKTTLSFNGLCLKSNNFELTLLNSINSFSYLSIWSIISELISLIC